MSLRFLAIGALFLAISVSAFAQARDSRDALVVSRDWVAQHLADPSLVLLHVGEASEYKTRHLPGARFVTMEDVSIPMDRSKMSPADLRPELLGADRLRTQLQALGISDASQIVVYYGNDRYTPATRIIFALTYAGLGPNTRLLDGGMPAWIRDGRETTADEPAPKAGRLSPLRIQPLVVDAKFVQTQARASGFAVVDARDRVFYDGGKPSGTGDARGHIPGALSVPYVELFDERGALRPAAELDAIFTKAGVKPGDTVVGYCHIGQQATALLFAARTLGHPVRLYDGSMNDWLDRLHLPLELPSKKN